MPNNGMQPTRKKPRAADAGRYADRRPMSQRCSVPGCSSAARYAVFQKWFGPYPEEVERRREDQACQRICHEHMVENEARSVRVGAVKGYPYTNADRYGWWSEYDPLETEHDVLYSAAGPVSLRALHDTSTRLLERIRVTPEQMHQLTARQFEELIAAGLAADGFSVQLTPITRDGGVDIFASRRDAFGSLLYIVECKKHASRPVGIGVVQRVWGVVNSLGATKGLVATTSTFSRPAREFAKVHHYELSLSDFRGLAAWLSGVKTA